MLVNASWYWNNNNQLASSMSTGLETVDGYLGHIEKKKTLLILELLTCPPLAAYKLVTLERVKERAKDVANALQTCVFGQGKLVSEK